MRGKRQLNNLFVVLLVMLIAISWSIPAAASQNSTVLKLEPDLVSVPLGNQVQLQLRVLEGVEVNAFDIELEYDADVLLLERWSYGDLLSQLSDVKLVNESGYFWLAATQLAQPVVSGSGVLLSFIFSTVGLGESTIDLIGGKLANAQGYITFPELEDALVRVVDEPTYTPTFTPTSVRTATPVWTATNLPSKTPTATATSLSSATPTATRILQPSQTSAWTDSSLQGGYPVGSGNQGIIGEQVTPAGDQNQIGGNSLSGGEVNIAGGMVAELPLEPGHEKTAQVAHYATLMAQVEAMQAEALPIENSQSSLETVLWIILIIGLVILAVLLVIAIRRRRKTN